MVAKATARKRRISAKSPLALGWKTLRQESDDVRLSLRGAIPDWLCGTLLRVGPAIFEAGKTPFRHWFDGQAMLHRFSMQGKHVFYSNRILQTRAWRHIQDTGKIGYREFATDPCRSIFARFVQIFSPKITDNCNVNISSIAERFIALTETPVRVEFDPKTLRTAGVFSYQDKMKEDVTTAHPHYDALRQEEINFRTRFGPVSRHHVYQRSASSGTRRTLGSVSTYEPSYIHSFAVTRKYVVLVECPFVVQPLSLLLSGKPFIENFSWKPKKGTTFTIIDRQTGKVKDRIITDPFFMFHHVNAFDAGQDIMVDLIAFPDARIIDSLYLKSLRSENRCAETGVGGELRRYRVSLRHRHIRSEVLSDDGMELPRIHYRAVNGKEYRYMYAAGSDVGHPENFLDRLLKVDVQRSHHWRWHEKNCFPGEPVFIPHPQSKAEDDGVIVSVVLDTVKKNSFLLILDASSFSEIGRAQVPHHIPFGFHGQFSPSLARS